MSRGWEGKFLAPVDFKPWLWVSNSLRRIINLREMTRKTQDGCQDHPEHPRKLIKKGDIIHTHHFFCAELVLITLNYKIGLIKSWVPSSAVYVYVCVGVSQDVCECVWAFPAPPYPPLTRPHLSIHLAPSTWPKCISHPLPLIHQVLTHLRNASSLHTAIGRYTYPDTEDCINSQYMPQNPYTQNLAVLERIVTSKSRLQQSLGLEP